jgi:adenosylhomocysteine nucleosidase
MSASTGVVVVAAERREFAGLLRESAGVNLDWPVDFARLSRGFVLLANGPGPALSAKAVREAARHTQIGALVSTGFCGGLDPRLAVGDIVIGDSVLDGASGERYRAAIPDTPAAAKTGLILSMDRVAVTAGEKAVLQRSTGACCIEMEAAAVARLAREFDVPFYCIRAVSDSADCDLGVDFNAFRDGEGRFSRVRIALAAVQHPRYIRPLLNLDRDCRTAARRLGDFFANLSAPQFRRAESPPQATGLPHINSLCK